MPLLKLRFQLNSKHSTKLSSMSDLVHKVSSLNDEGVLEWYTLKEFIEMPTAQRVLLTIGKRQVTYYDENGEEVRKGKAIVFIGKKRREWMDSTGQKY